MCVHRVICFFALSAERALQNNTLGMREHIQHPDLALRNRGSFEKWLILGLEQDTHTTSLKHLTAPESETVLSRHTEKAHIKGAQKTTESPQRPEPEELAQPNDISPAE